MRVQSVEIVTIYLLYSSLTILFSLNSQDIWGRCQLPLVLAIRDAVITFPSVCQSTKSHSLPLHVCSKLKENTESEFLFY